MVQTGGVSRKPGHTVRKSSHKLGLTKALEEKPRNGAPSNIDGRLEAPLPMGVCSAPPAGSGRWPLQLLADNLVELAVVEAVSLPTVHTALKKMN